MAVQRLQMVLMEEKRMLIMASILVMTPWTYPGPTLDLRTTYTLDLPRSTATLCYPDLLAWLLMVGEAGFSFGRDALASHDGLLSCLRMRLHRVCWVAVLCVRRMANDPAIYDPGRRIASRASADARACEHRGRARYPQR